MNCEGARAHLSAWMDGEYPSDELSAHVEACPSCTERLRRYRHADELLRSAAARLFVTCETARARLSAWLDGEDRSPELDAHVLTCPSCADRVRRYQRADDLLRRAARARRKPRTTRRPTPWGALAAAAALLAATTAALWINLRSAPPLEVVLYARPETVSGAPTRMTLVVRNHHTRSAIAGARIHTRIGNDRVETTTDQTGVALVSFTAPEQGDSITAVTEVVSDIGRETLTHSFALRRPHKILISTDKPLYQPGQTVHLRTLAVHTFTQRPLSHEDVSVEIIDARGHKILRRVVKTSDFGSASLDLDLVDEAPTGAYHIRAVAGSVASERAFEVRRYLLPKFKIELDLDRTFYAPGQGMAGRLNVRYHFGEPVRDARVRITSSPAMPPISGRTDSKGRFEFTATVPASQDGLLHVEARVVDSADGAETTTTTVPVSEKPLKVCVLPEGGAIVPGAENRLFVVTTRPDGTPAHATLTIDGRDIPSDGIAAVITADLGPITARDAEGTTVRATPGGGTRSFAIRPDAYRLRAGQPLGLIAIAAFPEGSLYVELAREGVALHTATLQIREGRGELVVDLPPEAAGSLRLSAWRARPDGSIECDARTIVVEPANGLSIRVDGPDTVPPGEEIPIEVAVRDAAGNPVVAELALALVDEAVFALHERNPLANAELAASTAEAPPPRPAGMRGYPVRQQELDHFAQHFNRKFAFASAVFLLLLACATVGTRRRLAALAGLAGGLVLLFLALATFVPPDLAVESPEPPAPPRVREHFPETLYWNPSVITGADGRAHVIVPGADSITTWRITASGASRNGALGAATRPLRVLQDFFVDIDAPAAMTQGDLVSLPVRCHNHLPFRQEIAVRLTADDGVELRDSNEKTVALGPDEVDAVYFNVRAARPGVHRLTVTAQGAHVQDAVRRAIEVRPDGKEQEISTSDAVRGRRTLRVRVPEEAVDGAGSLHVRLFPSRLSEATVGLDRLMRLPHG